MNRGLLATVSPNGSLAYRLRGANRRALFALDLLVIALGVSAGACSSQSSSPGSGASNDTSPCSELHACCAGMTGVAATTCESIASGSTPSASTSCADTLQGYQASGLCVQSGQDAASPPLSDGAAPAVPVDGVALSVDKAAQVASVGTVTPPSGDIYVAIELLLTNGGGATLPLLTPLFNVVTSSGLQYAANTLTTQLTGGCDPTASLTTGSQITCSVLFQVPTSDAIAQVRYTLPNLAMVAAPVSSVTTCTVCAGACVDLLSDSANCGSCGNAAPGGCTNGVPSCASVDYVVCNNACVLESADRCGPCGQEAQCAYPANSCVNGQCALSRFSDTPTSCQALCGSDACLLGSVTYGGPLACAGTKSLPCAETATATVDTCTLAQVDCYCGT